MMSMIWIQFNFKEVKLKIGGNTPNKNKSIVKSKYGTNKII